MRRGAPLATLAAAALCGCGGGSLSMTQLRSQATPICAAATRRTNRISTPTSPTGGVAFLRMGAAALAPELKELRLLRPASDLTEAYSTALRASSAELRALRATLRQLDHGGDPVVAIKTLQHRLAPIESRANRAWQTLDIPACLNR